jgi:hypothetical protein
MGYIFRDNTDYQQGVFTGSKRRLFRMLRRYWRGEAGNLYWYTIQDASGGEYELIRGPRGGFVDLEQKPRLGES